MAVQCAKVLALLERRLSLLLPPPPTGPFLDLNLNASSSSPTGKMSWLFINTSAAAAASTPPSGHIPSKTIEMSCRRIAALFYRRLRSSSRYVLGHFSPFFFVRAYSYCSSSRPQILSAEPKMSSISSSSPIASREILGDRCKEGVDDTSFSLLRESGPRE